MGKNTLCLEQKKAKLIAFNLISDYFILEVRVLGIVQ